MPANWPGMVGFEMFCERCGKRYGNGEAPSSTSLPLSKRLLKAVGVSASAPPAPAEEPLLRFCLACRGYSCPECWNEDAGFCQTCVPTEMPVAEQPVINLPALEMPAPPKPMMTFEPTNDLPPYLAMLADGEAPHVDPLADFVVEPGAEVQTETEVETDTPAAFTAESELELTADAEADVAEPVDEAASIFEVQPLVEFEAEVEAELVAAVEPDAEAFAEAAEAAEVAEDAAAEAGGAEEVEAVAVVAEDADYAEEAAHAEEAEDALEPVAAAVAAEEVEEAVVAVETVALDERPIELVFADEEMTAETEPETSWEWDFVSVTDTDPVQEPEPSAQPLAAASDEASTPEPGPLVEAPVVPAQPQVLPPPVYKPLTPLGPIMPPPPPAAPNVTPTINFDAFEPPPAFVIAPQQAQALMRPQLPAGMFDGPAPQIRPCHHCDLPVSAKARFCRRCGSAQPA